MWESMSIHNKILRGFMFSVTCSVVFLLGFGLAPETSLLVMLLLSLAYGAVVFLAVSVVVWLVRKGVEGTLLATIFVVAIIVVSVAAGSYDYRFGDTRELPRYVFLVGASYINELLGTGSASLPDFPLHNATNVAGPKWVQLFMNNISTIRTRMGLAVLVENETLDKFARLRARTTLAHFQISHYGREQDFSCFYLNCIADSELEKGYFLYDQNALKSVLGANSTYLAPMPADFWQLFLSCGNCTSRTVYFPSREAVIRYMHLTYGNYTRVIFEGSGVLTLVYPQEPNEEILYPQGSPSSYVAFLQRYAKLHWRGFLEPKLTSYGFDLEVGVAIIPHEPCGVTEIPGPGIDIGQFYTQHGCGFDFGSAEWLVVELGG